MIIGFSGPKGSGKDYVASALLESIQNGYKTISGDSLSNRQGWAIASFADPLRAFVLDVFNMDNRHSEGHLKEVVVRSLLPTHHHVRAACKHHFGDIAPASLISRYLTTNQEQSKLISGSYRSFMQYIGTELIRHGIDEDYWVKMMELRSQGEHLIISDVRLDNEADFVRKGGILVHIQNPDVGFSGEHSTEVGLDMGVTDLAFTNDTSLTRRQWNASLHDLKLRIEERLYG